MNEEQLRLQADREGTQSWKRWGPYLSERAWGTVREDYSPDGSAWDYFPHDHARSRAYRWNEDGLAGICDDRQILCFALGLWNERDPILKERLFGLTGTEGSHGEDVKEYYYYLDSTPTHSYMKLLYKYPQAEFPYERLVEENRSRGKESGEWELLDSGVFQEDRYWDVLVEYAKAGPDEILIRISAANRGPEAATLHLIPTLWFRNTWAWHSSDLQEHPSIAAADGPEGARSVQAEHPRLGTHRLLFQKLGDGPELLFTENDTNVARLFPGSANPSPYVKDAFHERIIHGREDAVNPAGRGTKAGGHYRLDVPAGETAVVRLRLSGLPYASDPFGASFDHLMDDRRADADAFYAEVAPPDAPPEVRLVQRQALAGLLWSKQFYHYNVHKWLEGDPGEPTPPESRWYGRNRDWQHLDNSSVISMPDKWEYPWYAAWDLAFHTIALSLVDSDFAKEQLILLLREWFMHPNGQLPAYEWAFGDVNPPVHAWAARRVYQIERRIRGFGDVDFLKRVFHKLLLNFTWWVNRTDREGNNIFSGGFLGLDNIGVFDRSSALPTGGYLEQADATSWMATYCLNMLAIALELADHDPSYEDLATKFLEHFFAISYAMNCRQPQHGDDGVYLWDAEDEFYYDVLRMPDRSAIFLRIRSVEGLLPLLAVETLEPELLERLPGFRERMEWFLKHNPDRCGGMADLEARGQSGRRLFAVVDEHRFRRILARMLDETEFLSPHGIRSVSRVHQEHPYRFEFAGHTYQVDYEPAESLSGLFGGNSNWRGPIWFPINYLLIESLQRFDYFFGGEFRVECPTGSGQYLSLWEVATELSRRLIGIFVPDETGRRPVFGDIEKFQQDPNWKDHLLFFEYFHGDTGAGLGASHQTGWTALVAKLIQQSGGEE